MQLQGEDIQACVFVGGTEGQAQFLEIGGKLDKVTGPRSGVRLYVKMQVQRLKMSPAFSKLCTLPN